MAERTKKQILIVDDDPNITNMLGTMFELYGFNVRMAHGTAQGMAAVTAEMPDVVLLDVMMPHLSGLELCRYVRRDPRTAKLPVIIFSALGNEEHVRAGLAAGATAYVKKTSSKDELMKAIADALKPSTR